jgi:hypothetical protein
VNVLAGQPRILKVKELLQRVELRVDILHTVLNSPEEPAHICVVEKHTGAVCLTIVIDLQILLKD